MPYNFFSVPSYSKQKTWPIEQEHHLPSARKTTDSVQEKIVEAVITNDRTGHRLAKGSWNF
jgi:hypothetical protein